MNNKFQMLPNFAKVFLVLLFLLTSSCALNCCTTSINDYKFSYNSVLPRESFVKIEKVIKVQICPDDIKELTQCKSRSIASSASGFVVKNDEEGSYIITAAHVCDNEEIKTFLKMTKNSEIVEKKFEIIDIDKIRYKFFSLTYDDEIDVCVGYSYSVTKPPVRLATHEPNSGDVVYNLAAPIGIFDENAIPILHGNFIGISKDQALYTVPAAGGSSGSPLLNSNGELIGLIHSVYVRFPFITISPTYKQLINFINTHSDKDVFILQSILDTL